MIPAADVAAPRGGRTGRPSSPPRSSGGRAGPQLGPVRVRPALPHARPDPAHGPAEAPRLGSPRLRCCIRAGSSAPGSAAVPPPGTPCSMRSSARRRRDHGRRAGRGVASARRHPMARSTSEIPELLAELDCLGDPPGTTRVAVRAVRRRAALVHRQHDHPGSGVAQADGRARCASPTTPSVSASPTVSCPRGTDEALEGRRRGRRRDARRPVRAAERDRYGSARRWEAIIDGVAPNELTGLGPP